MRARAWPICLMLVAVALAPAVPAMGPDEGGGAARADLGLYHTYDEMVSELQNLTAANPDITKLVSLGKTYENRTIWAVKLSDNVAQDELEPNITMMGGIHARELIGVEVPIYILEWLVDSYSRNDSVKRLVDGAQIWFVPMLNPDGHVYVEQTGDWRKNRHPYTGGIGVDLNRNFGHMWGAEASHDPSAEDFCGPGPFSENETLAVSGLVRAHPMAASLSYHSGFATILYPWGNSIDQADVDPALPSLAENMSLAMPAERRLVPRMAREVYPATGDTDDWLYANLSVLAFTVELSTSFRPLEGQVGQICSDNLPPAILLMDMCIPRHALSARADRTQFKALPGTQATVNISVSNEGNSDETVSLSASSNLSWDMSMVPEMRAVSRGKNASFSLTVTVPGDAPAFQVCGISVAAAGDGGGRAAAFLNITVQKQHRLNISMVPPGASRPDSTVTVNITVTNAGNGMENLSLGASTVNEWDLPSLALPFPLYLLAQESANFSVAVAIPPDAPAGPTGRLIFKAMTNDENDTYMASESCVLTVLQVKDLSLRASATRITLKQGEKRNITIELINRGNAPESVFLNLSGDYGLSALNSTSLNISPFSNASVVLSLEGKRPGGNLSVWFISEPGGKWVGQNLSITVTAEGAGNATNPTPPANAILVLVLGTVALVAALAFIVWDLRRHEERERMERDRYRRIASRRPGKDDGRPPEAGRRTGRGP